MKTNDEEKLQAIVDAIAEQGVVVSNAMKKITELQVLLKDTCDHPRKTLKDLYSEGSYYDREEWTTKEFCAYCGEDFGVVKRAIGGYG